MLDCSYYHKEFRRRINRRNTSYSERVGVLDVDDYINEASEVWYKAKIKEAEQDSIIRGILAPFKVKNKPLKIECKGMYYKAKFPADYYYPLNYMIYGSKEGCDNCPKLMSPFIVQSDDLVEGLKDPNRSPSFGFGEVLIDDSKTHIDIYTNGEFSIDKVDISYYKKLDKIQCPKLAENNFYVDYNGNTIRECTTFLIDNRSDANDIIDIAVLFFLRDVEDNQSLDTQLLKINSKKI